MLYIYSRQQLQLITIAFYSNYKVQPIYLLIKLYTKVKYSKAFQSNIYQISYIKIRLLMLLIYLYYLIALCALQISISNINSNFNSVSLNSSVVLCLSAYNLLISQQVTLNYIPILILIVYQLIAKLNFIRYKAY